MNHSIFARSTAIVVALLVSFGFARNNSVQATCTPSSTDTCTNTNDGDTGGSGGTLPAGGGTVTAGGGTGGSGGTLPAGGGTVTVGGGTGSSGGTGSAGGGTVTVGGGRGNGSAGTSTGNFTNNSQNKTNVSAASSGSTTNFLKATDGRVNPDDMGRQTETGYCQADGSLQIWAVYGSKGYYKFTVPYKQLTTALDKAQTEKQHQEVGDKDGWQLWALYTQDATLQQLQLHDAHSEYSYWFKLCPIK